jgi:hypothetical protein
MDEQILAQWADRSPLGCMHASEEKGLSAKLFALRYVSRSSVAQAIGARLDPCFQNLDGHRVPKSIAWAWRWQVFGGNR